MILFYVTRESETLKRVSNEIREETQMKVAWLNQEKLVSTGLFYSENIDNKITGFIQTPDMPEPISTEDIKVCFIANFPSVYGEWIPYDNHFDILYAQQEWNASITATFVTQSQVKYINPIWPRHDLNSEIEQFMVMQKFGINTVEIALTNNSKKAVEKYNMWNRNVMFKSVRSGYDTSVVMEIPDLGRLEKLSLSPVIFQKQIPGKDIIVCLLGNSLLVNEIEYINNFPKYNPVKLSDDLKNKLIKVSEYIKTPWIQFNFLYIEEEKEYLAYGMNIYPDFDMVYNAFGEPFVRVLKNYLVEEYYK